MTQPRKQDKSKWSSIMLSKQALQELRGQLMPGESYETMLRRRRIIR